MLGELFPSTVGPGGNLALLVWPFFHGRLLPPINQGTCERSVGRPEAPRARAKPGPIPRPLKTGLGERPSRGPQCRPEALVSHLMGIHRLSDYLVDWVRTDGFSAMGMEWDGEWLWSAQTMTAEGGAPASRIGRSRVVAYDTEGRERAIFAPQDSLDHWFGDLTVGADGVVVVSDSRAPGLYRIVNGRMMPWLTGDPFVSPQGLAFLDGSLYVADYSVGLFRVDPKAGTVRWMETPPGTVLMGIDGLEAGGGFLWGIQNGTSPTRVLRIQVSGDRVRDVRAFDIGHPDHSDPTLGLIRSDSLFYVANSQWPLFGPDAGEGARQPPIVLALPLDAE